MTSRKRHFEAGYVYHVLNRRGERKQLFYCERDYDAFESQIQETWELFPLPILTYELMPNHWHFSVQPENKQQLSCFFQHLSGTHAKKFRVRDNSAGEGHVYQDRFKSFPVQEDMHLLLVCRYIERNALRAGLVSRAEDWKWSGLYRRLHSSDDFLVSEWPVARPSNWLELVNQPLTEAELSGIRKNIRRGSPFGGADWVKETAERLGLEHTLRRRGRPREIVLP